MEEIQNGSLTVCSRSSSTFSQPLLKATELSGNDASNKEGEEENSGKPLTWREVLLLLPNGETILKNWDVYEEEKDITLLNFFKHCYSDFLDWEPDMQCDLIILKKMSDVYFKLLHDNRFLKPKRKKTYNTFFGIIINSKGGLLKIVNSLSEMPRLHSNNYQPFEKEEKLWKLVNLPEEVKNPTTYEETNDFVERHNLKATFNFGYYPSNKSWSRTLNTFPEIEAFTKSDYTLGFRPKKPEKGVHIPKVVAKEIIVIEPDECQNNYSAAVKIKLGGLNEAFSLGCISREEFNHLSEQLSNTNGSLWLELDDKKEARFATFSNGYQCELSQDETTWTRLFDVIFQYKEKMEERKKNILSGLVEKLEKYPSPLKSAWSSCLVNLRACIKEFKVVVYSKEDESLHSIKAYFCYYARLKKRKNFRGVHLNSGAKNDLTLIKSLGLVFFNFGSYLEFDTTELDKTLPQPVISSATKDIKNQKKQVGSSKTIFQLCKDRGVILCEQLLKAYINTGKNFIDYFEYDIFSLPYCALSSLAFKTIWHKYTRLAGIFHHGLEKTKMFQEDVLRKFCTGGFAYSCRDRVNCGESFNKANRDLGQPTAKEEKNETPLLAQTIREYDLNSSYGYAASNMSCPVGFCTGYTNVEGKDLLTRCDQQSRFNGFEFLSVYYTLWKLSHEENVNIRTVYSNFHQYGFLQLGKFTIDLVVITEEGRIMFYAFDGAWAHGCRAGCPSLKNYVGRKTRKQVEESSAARDVVISDWCKQLNEKMSCSNFATYQVITDCHHSEYKVHALKKYFQSRPELKKLTDGYFSDNLITQDDAIFANDKLTFLAVVKGRVPKNNRFPQQHPLFLRGNDRRWDRYASTDSSEEGILLTRDYLQYLVKEHNFQIEKIEKIYFYKKCAVLPTIFKELVDTRALSSISKEKKQLLKKIVNYAAGYFGYNEIKHQTSTVCRLVTALPKRYIYNTYRSTVEDVAWIGKERIIFVKVLNFNQNQRRVSKCALPLYICVTEWGKKRLAETFCYFEKYLLPNTFRLLYSNVDNAIVCLATNELEEAADPRHLDKFVSLKSSLFSKTKPGHLKEEFIMYPASEWKFVSGMTHNYCILTNDKNIGVHKNSALRKVSNQQSYDAACAVLDRIPMVISQERRTNKMAHLETVLQNFCFK